MANRAFKTREQLEERKAFVKSADKEIPESNQLDIFMPNLKRLGIDELEERLVDLEWQYEDKKDNLERQYLMLKWKICMYIRDKFKSDKLFGQHINELREKNPTHPLCNSKSASLSRYINAGRFCEQYKILDLNAAKIYPSSIYHLSAPGNSDIAKEIYKEIKGKNVSAADVRRKIEQRRAVLTIEREPEIPEPNKIEYKRPESTELQHVEVKNNIAQGEHKPITEFIQAVKEKVFHHTVIEDDDEYIEQEKVDDPHRKELLQLISQFDASMLSDDEIVDEIMIFVEQYNRAGTKLIPLFQAAIERARPVYPRR